MNCSNCGNYIPNGDLFCTKCGTPASNEKRCPNCQALLEDDDLFCGKCGTRVGGGQSTPVANQESFQPDHQVRQADYQAPQPNFQPQQTNYQAPQPNYMPPHQNFANNWNTANNRPNPQQGYQNPQNGSYNPGYGGAQPQKYHMVSKYIGEPTLGIAKATGTLNVYPDRLEYSKLIGNALASQFGLAGMLISRSKMKNEEGLVDVYYYHEIQTAYVGKYAGLMPAVVLVMNDGQVFSFNGPFTNQSAANIVNMILYNK